MTYTIKIDTKWEDEIMEKLDEYGEIVDITDKYPTTICYKSDEDIDFLGKVYGVQSITTNTITHTLKFRETKGEYFKNRVREVKKTITKIFN